MFEKFEMFLQLCHHHVDHTGDSDTNCLSSCSFQRFSLEKPLFEVGCGVGLLLLLLLLVYVAFVLLTFFHDFVCVPLLF